jgi:hypothetical protein
MGAMKNSLTQGERTVMRGASSTPLDQVKRAWVSGKLSRLKEPEAWEIFDRHVIDWLIGASALRFDLTNEKFLEQAILEQPSVICNVDQIKELIRMRDKGEVAEIDKKLRDSAKACISHWKRKLAIRKYRQADRKDLEEFARSARLKEQGRSWTGVTQAAFPREYGDKKTRKAAISRVRQEVRRFQKARKDFLLQVAIARP